MCTLSKLPNVGKVLEKNLISVGVNTPEELRRIGAAEAFIRVKMIEPGACLHMLYGLQGAVEGIRYTGLTDDTKEKLRAFFKSLG